MINNMQKALIRKEMRDVIRSGGFFTNYLLVPIMMAIIIPVAMVLVAAFAEIDTAELSPFLEMLNVNLAEGTEKFTLVSVLINYMIPPLFLMIPIMIVTVVASASFTGEKERRTLETLLYTPMSLRRIFTAKIVTALLLGMMVTLISFAAMVIFVMILTGTLMGEVFVPSAMWIIILLLVSPAVSWVGIIVQVRISAKAKTSEEAYQRGGILVLPLLLLMIGQISGFMVVGPLVFTGIGVGVLVIGWIMMRLIFKNISYETLLR